MDALEFGKVAMGEAQEGVNCTFIDRLAPVDVEVN